MKVEFLGNWRGPDGEIGPRGERGLPGTNGVATDDAVAQNIAAQTPTKTQEAGDARYHPTEGYRSAGASFIRPIGKGELVIRPEDFGATGTSDDTAVLQACLSYAASQPRRYRVWLNGDYTIKDTLFWDVSRVSVTGTAEIRSEIHDETKYMVRTVSSDPGDITSPVRQSSMRWEGVILHGDKFTGGFDISGRNFSDKPAHVAFLGATVTRCGTAVYFGENAYMIKFSQCNITLSRIGIKHDGKPNSGERLSFVDCDITGHGRAIEMTSGQAMHFLDCSFSYVLRQVAYVTTGQLFFEACHFEFSTPYAPFFEIAGNGGYIVATDCRWLLRDQPGINSVMTFENGSGTWTQNDRQRFRDGDGVRFRGLSGDFSLVQNTLYYLRNVTETGFELSETPGGPKLNFTGTGRTTTIVPAGDGTVPIFATRGAASLAHVRGGHVSGSSQETNYWNNFSTGSFKIEETVTFGSNPLLLHTSERGDLRDGRFAQAGIRDYWTAPEAADTVNIDTTDRNNGINSLRFVKGASGTSSRLVLYVPVERGRHLLDFWYKSDANVPFQAQWVDRPGAFASNASSAANSSLWNSTLTSSSSWRGYRNSGLNDSVSPHWAKWIQFTWSTNGLPTGGQLKIDMFRFSTM